MEVAPIIAIVVSILTLLLSAFGARQKTVWQRRADREEELEDSRKRLKECEEGRRELKEELAQSREETFRALRKLTRNK